MKNLSIALNILLVIAVAILFYLHFASSSSEKQATGNTDPIADDSLTAGRTSHGSIATISVDSLLLNYQLSIDLNEKMQRKRSSLEAKYQRRTKNFEEEYMKFMDKVQRGSFLSQARAQEEEQRLTKERDDLLLYEQDVSRELMEEGAEMEKQLLDSVINFLKEFNSDNRFQYIINSASCLYKDDALNITDTVIATLNKRYAPAKVEEDK